MRLGAAALVAISLWLAGCGFGPGEEREGGVELHVTRDFGRELLTAASMDSVREDETVMRFLRREADVETRFGGRFVQSIDGLAGAGVSGQRDWFFFVNGLESSEGAGDYELSPGDRVQWDHRNWEATMRVPAIVGAYPEPFLNGVGGKRRPVRVECEEASSSACETVKERLRDLGVAATGSSLGTSGTTNVIRVVVGRWDAVKLVQAVAELEEGPEDSGVFARFGDDELELLDEAGEVALKAPPGTGVIAATAPSEEEIVWAVTALDERGVERAAAAFDERTDAFAVVVTDAGPEHLPLEDWAMRVPVPAYRQRASALHSARAGVGAAFCFSLAYVVVLYAHPLVLGAVVAAVIGAGAACGVGREIARSALLALPFALLIAVINPLVYQGGDTLLIRGGELLGHRLDVTLEALVAGALAGVRIMALVLCFGLFTAAVDPDEVLKLLRRWSYRSALTASLATRLVPVLARDAFRMGDAARCRPEPPGRFAVARAALAGALDRAVDVAAALEVRGYATAGRPRNARAAWSRHDVRLALAAVLIVVVATAARVAGAGEMELYPLVEIGASSLDLALCGVLIACVLLPLAGPRARLGVAHG